MDELYGKAEAAIAASKKLSHKDGGCDVERFFPCHDCSHIAVAVTMLHRAKFSDITKDRIMGYIEEKAKLFGCAKTDSKFKYISLSSIEKKLYSSEAFSEARRVVEASIRNPGMELV